LAKNDTKNCLSKGRVKAVKKCPKCNLENDDAMNFCVGCGTLLANVLPTEQPTVFYPNPTPTEPSQGQETQTVVRSFQPPPTTPTVVTNQPSYTPPSTPNTLPVSNFSPTPPPPQKSGSKTFLIIAGVVGVLILGVIGVIGIGIVALYSQGSNAPTPTPTSLPVTPTRTSTPIRMDTPQTPTNTVHSADYKDMWVDFNVTEAGQKGMRMHVSFTTKNMKDVESYLAIYLQKNDGTPVYGKMTSYRSKTGQVAVFKLLRPAFEVAEYQDTQLFIPYTAFGLPRGKYDLQMNVNLIYKTDGLIQHLHVYDFQFEQK
jgi:hypothetical protein